MKETQPDPAATHTVPLFSVDPAGIPSLLGTMVFVVGRSRKYLISARHVIEDDARGLFLPTPKGLVGAIGQIIYPQFTNANGDSTSLDIAILQLDHPDPEELLSQFAPFLITPDCNLLEPIVGAECRALGYPATRSEPDFRNRRVSSVPLLITTEVVSVQRELQPGSFSIQFTKDRKRGPLPRYAPDPHGMSGCGIWTNGTSGQLCLLGIAIEYEKAPLNTIGCLPIRTVIPILEK